MADYNEQVKANMHQEGITQKHIIKNNEIIVKLDFVSTVEHFEFAGITFRAFRG
jgi:hypothetical protein